MKLVSIEENGKDKAGILFNDRVYSFVSLGAGLPFTMKEFLDEGEKAMDTARTIHERLKQDPAAYEGTPLNEVKLIAPVPHPTSCRDGYAFRQHVATARRNRGVEMIPEFDQYPIFYFTNHNAIYGPGEIELMPDHFQKLDFELEAGIVIGKKGRNVRASEADSYIAGYLIMNDLSARTLQMEEMKLNLGPAKGKDFATSIGPYMVTPDELESRKVATKPGHTGNQYDLSMKAFVNGKQVSEGNMSQMDWTFAEIIERAAYGVDIYPGDVIGSGTVGTGCFLELNGTGLLNDKNYTPQWLQPEDEIALEIDMLGRLSNKMKEADTDFSILGLKKNV